MPTTSRRSTAPVRTVEYRDALRSVLDSVSQFTAVRLSATHRAATAGADGVLIDVFVEQDAEGPFGVWARFDGPDSFSLDRQVGDERELFSVIWVRKAGSLRFRRDPPDGLEQNSKAPSLTLWPNGSIR